MKTYGQFCPLAQATQLLCERWTLIIVRELLAGSTRFNELQKGVPLMSPTLLSARLKQLVEAGVIDRSGTKGAYAYCLAPAGQELRPVVELLGAWGHRWARSDLNKGDLDAGLLMWDMRRTVDPAVFPRRRIVVKFAYPDAPKGARDWWLVSANGEMDLCLDDPGHDVDIMITCPLKTMTEVWTCQRRFRDAVKSGDVNVMGDPKLALKLQDWLRSSPLSKLGTRDELPELDWASG
ncbi:MAG: hypothetical protein FD165_2492 [Gammaproteobacteria bacterium]|nr:MAG: hypothetical protein FD165_2492 [Gammaproteobacteria bacterium]TND02921.1 MAG: hypothetical protein FD120_1990 [Gammaproteobacteria bacterium]